MKPDRLCTHLGYLNTSIFVLYVQIKKKYTLLKLHKYFPNQSGFGLKMDTLSNVSASWFEPWSNFRSQSHTIACWCVQLCHFLTFQLTFSNFAQCEFHLSASWFKPWSNFWSQLHTIACSCEQLCHFLFNFLTNFF